MLVINIIPILRLMPDINAENNKLTLEEKLDLILDYYRAIKKNDNRFDPDKWQELAKKITGGNNHDFRILTEHVDALGFVDASETPEITPKGEAFIGFVKTAEKSRLEKDKALELSDLHLENLKLQNEILKRNMLPASSQVTLYDKLIKWGKNNRIVVAFILVSILTAFFVGLINNGAVLAGFFKHNTNNNTLKIVSGKITDEDGNPIQGAYIKPRGQTFTDTTDSFGEFSLSLTSSKQKTKERIQIIIPDQLDTVLSVGIDYTIHDPVRLNDIVFSVPSPSLKRCLKGNKDACYEYAAGINQDCPTTDGQARNICIMKVELWKAVGDSYEDMMIAKRDSGVNSLSYKNKEEKWLHSKGMAIRVSLDY